MRRTLFARSRIVGFGVALVVVVGAAACSSESKGSSTSQSAADATGNGNTFCSLLTIFRNANDSLDAEVNSGDTDRARVAVTRLVDQAELLQTRAPADLKPDVDAVVVYVTSLDQLFAEYGYDIDAFVGNEEASAKFLTLTSDEVDSSLLQLRSYAETTCVATGAASTTTVPPVTTTAG